MADETHRRAGGTARQIRAEVVPIGALRRIWQNLERRSASPLTFNTFEYMSTWWRHFHHGRHAHVLLVSAGAQPIGVVPLYLEVRRSLLGRVGVLRNMGSRGRGTADLLDAVAVDGRERDVVRAAAHAIAHDGRWDYAEWADIDRDGLMAAIGERISRAESVVVETEQRAACPVLALPQRFDELLGDLEPSFRRRVRRTRQRLERRGRVVWREAGRDIAPRCALRLLNQLIERQAHAGIRPAWSAEQQRFHAELAERLSRRGDLALWIVMHESQPIGANYGFFHDGAFCGYRMAYAPEWSRYSVGHYLIAGSIERLIHERGAHTLHFLRGSDPWKRRWTERARRNVTLRWVRAGWLASWRYWHARMSGPRADALRFLIGPSGADEITHGWQRFRALIDPQRAPAGAPK